MSFEIRPMQNSSSSVSMLTKQILNGTWKRYKSMPWNLERIEMIEEGNDG